MGNTCVQFCASVDRGNWIARAIRFTIGLLVIHLAGAGPCNAATSWIAGLGAWHVGGNWTAAAPTLSTDAFISNGGFAVIDYPGYLPQALTLKVDGGSSLAINNSGPNATFFEAGFVRIGNIGSGQVSISNQATWSIGANVEIGGNSAGTLNILSGAHVINDGSAYLYNNAVVTVSGAGSTWNNSENTGTAFAIGFTGPAALNITAGGTVTSLETEVADFGGVATILIDGPGSSWTNYNGMLLGEYGTAKLTIQNGGAITNHGWLTIGAAGSIQLVGGTLTAGDVASNGVEGCFEFLSGTLRITGNQSFSAASGLGKALGSDFAISLGKTLYVDGTATLATPLKLDGGAFYAGQLVNSQNLDLVRGRFDLTNQALTIGTGGLFGDHLELRPEVSMSVYLGITNNGLISGNGRLGGSTLQNASLGEIRASAGNTITFAGVGGSNQGAIRLIGGMVEFFGPLTNNTAGNITGRGSLKTGGVGLTNYGHLALSSGVSDVFGDVTNSTGNPAIGISVSGNADVTFWDDVNNVGASLFRVSAGSSATFFGTYSGSGISGTGNVYFEADVTPGASPATASFGGTVSLGSTSALLIELGGVAAGAQYDQLHVTDGLILGGSLEVTLIDGFVPAAGNTFDILDWGALTGTFSSLSLPVLSGGKMWNTSQLYATGVLSVIAAIVPGDFDNDGDVDGADFVAWQTNLPKPNGATLAQGDADGDGDVDGADFVVWQTNFPFTPGPGAAASPVPEPSTIAISLFPLLLGAISLRRESNRLREPGRE
jgi:T5SS/PEP-CTERM-associated repeat protein